MTKAGQRIKEISTRALPFLLLALLFLALLHSGDVIAGSRDALGLCARVILPTLFPFMVLSELIGASFPAAPAKQKGPRLTSRLFGVSEVGVGAFLLGALSGFPLGVKHTRTLYDRGAIDGAECTRLLCFANNTGPAFVIAGVGALFGSLRVGLFFYLFEILSALLVGLILARFPAKEIKLAKAKRAETTLTFPAAVRKSAESALAVCGMIVFFSAISSLVSVFFKNDGLLLFISQFLEVSGACARAAEYRFADPNAALFAANFAVSFGGLSVHMQAMLFFEGGHFPLARYLFAKLAQGAIASLLLLLCLPII